MDFRIARHFRNEHFDDNPTNALSRASLTPEVRFPSSVEVETTLLQNEENDSKPDSGSKPDLESVPIE